MTSRTKAAPARHLTAAIVFAFAAARRVATFRVGECMPTKGTIACLTADGFEDAELLAPRDRLRDAGFRVEIIGIGAEGTKIRGKRGAEVRIDRSLEEVRPQEYVALLLPGGHATDELRADERAVAFVRNFDLLKRPIWAICHGPQLFLTAGLVRGRTMTAWRTVQRDLELAGARVVDEPLVIDGNWLTSRNPRDAEQYAWAFRDILLQSEEARAPVNPSIPSDEATAHV